jgi:hypothetical protein
MTGEKLVDVRLLLAGLAAECEAMWLAECDGAENALASATVCQAAADLARAWRALPPARQAAWIAEHEDCSCAERLRSLLARYEHHLARGRRIE